MGSQPIMPKLTRLADETKLELTSTQLAARDPGFEPAKLRQARLIQVVIIAMFCAFFMGAIGVMYLPPYLGSGKTSLYGTVMGLSDTTASIYSGYIATLIGEKQTF